MARKATSTDTPGTALVNWDEELAKQAEVAAGMEASAGGGQFFSTKGGQLSFNDMPIPGNHMAVIIVDSVLENVMYDGRYDPDVPQAPICFAFGRDEKDLKPHELVVANETAQHETCQGCPMNEWASAETGKGKACRNTRRLALVPAGTLSATGHLDQLATSDDLATAAMGFLKLPVTSVKGYATFVKSVAGALRRPPFGILTKISVIPDAKTQFRVVFSPLQPASDELMPVIMQRRAEASKLIEAPYSLESREAAPPPAKAGRGKPPASNRPPVKKGKY
ncbi:MAG: hypothetical protein PHU06_06295 [Gallionella sp.]|nr:hypothetical protein [Gallionella sp.]MDD4958424.1 hypothetical protein [Gallionella sp.]